jgi:hypothetical protein
MKRVLLLCLPVLMSVPFICTAQEEEPATSSYGLWKRNFAAPSYGLALYNIRVGQKGIPGLESNFTESNFLMPALDLRIFKGTNVSRRGGFYTGVEVGAIVFMPFTDETFRDDVIIHDVDSMLNPIDYPDAYDFTVEVHGGSVFIMMKYGMRIDLGVSLFGFSAGFELGAGAALQTMGYNIRTDIAEESSGSEQVSFNLVVEPSAEIAMRLGRNFRLFAKVGMLVMPTIKHDRRETDTWVIDNGMPDSPEDYRRYALQGYGVDVGTVGYDVRLGFALNFN